MVDEETRIFDQWMRSLKLQPTIVAMREKTEEMALRELQKTLKRIGPVDEETRNALETLVLSVSGKVLHDPICYLRRRTTEDGTAERIIDTARKFFNLDPGILPPRDHTRPDADADDTCPADDSEE